MEKKKGISNEGSKSEDEKKNKKSKVPEFFNRFSSATTRIAGSGYAFFFALIVIIVWGITGPIFNFSDTWQLVINTGTTIITFLMVFIIQHSQNKDTIAFQLKLNELIAASQASNKLISVEDLTDEELELMKKFYAQLSGLSKEEKKNTIHTLEKQEKSHEEEKEVEEEKKEVEKARNHNVAEESKMKRKTT